MAGASPPRWRQWWLAWLDRRLPGSSTITLSQRSIFIFPSGQGFAFLGLLLLMLVSAINYENSLIFLLAFLLGSLFHTAILHTFGNLSGLTITARGVQPVHAGGMAEFDVLLCAPPGREYPALRLGWPEGEWVEVSVPAGGEVTARVAVPARRRGWLRPGRLRVETRYPLGWLTAWTWVDLAFQALVYPRPLPWEGDAPLQAVTEGDRAVVGTEDFRECREYQPGDNPRHVAWKAWARGRPLMTKLFQAHVSEEHWLRWEDVPGDTELRLGRLAGRALTLARQEQRFGLQMPDIQLPPGQGDAHLHTVLRVLALHRLG